MKSFLGSGPSSAKAIILSLYQSHLLLRGNAWSRNKRTALQICREMVMSTPEREMFDTGTTDPTAERNLNGHSAGISSMGIGFPLTASERSMCPINENF